MTTIPQALAVAIRHHQGGRLQAAKQIYRQILQVDPNHAGAHNNLGLVLRDLGKLDASIACFRRVVELEPGYLDAHNNLGVALRDLGKPEAAIACYRQALALNPNLAGVHCNLALVLAEQGKLDEAIASGRRAVALNPNLADAHNNLGLALKDQGKLEEAAACCRRALELLDPGFVEAHSNLVYTQIFSPGCDAAAIGEEHRRWSQLHAAPLERPIARHPNDPAPDRRLRVGYVSPNFRDHVVGRNVLPLLREHDREQVEILCYSDALRPDEITRRFQGCADIWRDTAGLSHEALAQRIREDRVDLLIDLTLHLVGSRLLVFARQPAPVQATFAGYPGTTGLSAIGCRLTDAYLDPPGLCDRCYSEESIRLPETFWCYDPLVHEPEVNALPALEKGRITFGCLNNFCKVNPPVLKLWARVLNRVDRSRLVMMAGEGSHRQETLDLLAAEGVARNRVTFVVHQPRLRYLREYHGIDLGLDTVPYNGHTTSLDSLWMGVPVVTLMGSTVVGRAGMSQLMNLGLPELIASDPEHYVEIASELAQDLRRLSELRSTLRERMEASPLMDAPHFAQNIEAAYREMWRRWC